MGRAAAFAAGLLVLAVAPAFAQEAPGWNEVGGLFAERCIMCHSGAGAPLGLALDSHAAALAGSQRGPVLVPGEPGESELVRRIRGEASPRMPLVGEPLSEAEIAMVEAWVAAGLPGPDQAAEAPPAEAPAPEAVLPGPDEPVTFAHVEAIFMQRCVMCHSDAAPGGPPEGLRLDGYRNVVGGSERVVVLPGNPEASEIVRRVEGTAVPRMPFGGPPLGEAEIALIRQWVADGARDAAGDPAPAPVGREVRLQGVLTSEGSIDGIPFAIDAGTRIERPAVGRPAEMRGVVEADGSIRATRLRER